MVQKTICCSASLSAMNCSSQPSASKANSSAMPNSTTVSTVAPCVRASSWMSSVVAAAKTKASSGMATCAPRPQAPKPSTMASDAPKVAAAATPSVNGLASGLFSTVCISAPARPSAAPTSSAITA